MFYRVVQPFKYQTIGGVTKEALPGTCVDIILQRNADRLLSGGRISPVTLPSLIPGSKESMAPPFARTLRVGLFIYTSAHYSGGRIHLFQYANSLASLGAEVWYISNVRPIWGRDYPNHGIKYLIWGQDAPPPDLDILMTDGKGLASGYAGAYREQHPSSRFFVMNFETPNWVREFAPSIADKIASGHKPAMKVADALVANSRESAKYLATWIDRPLSDCSVLQPAVNTYSIDLSDQVKKPITLTRPYAVWTARGQKYKGNAEAAAAIWKLKTPFDLVTFGTATACPPENDKHRLHKFNQASDAMKFAVMRDAHVTLAPSLFEGFGMVPAESLAMGTPVITYDLPVLRDEYGDVPGLHLVKHNDKGAFTAKLIEIASTPKPKLDPTPIREKFGLDAMVKRVQNIPYHAFSEVRVSAQMIAYWGFLPEALEAVYPYVHQILVAYGPTPDAPEIDDGTLARLRAFPDPDHKIRIEARKAWLDKKDMRQWCHEQSTGNYNLVLDGDEIWTGFDKWMEAKIAFGAPRWVTLWHDDKHYVVDVPGQGHRWGKEIEPYGCICTHYRWSWLRRSYYWGAHCRLQDMNRKAVRIPGRGAADAVPECVLYHLGHVLDPKVMRAKHKFYRNRDGDDVTRKTREKAWHEWTDQLGDCGDGLVKEIGWDVPDIVKRAVASAKAIQL